jgi:formate dehydrogenase assembly factor FdhD
MTNSEIKNLQNIVMGYSYNERLINSAIALADTFEVKHLLIALKSGRNSFESRMVLQSFICRLQQK